MERATHKTTELLATDSRNHEIDPLPICTHIFNKGRHCRQAVSHFGGRFCATHARRHSQLAPLPVPLAELDAEISDATDIAQVSRFLAKVLRLACQNRIGIRRAAALTYIANSLLNSLLNSLRLLNAEDRIVANDPANLEIDWTGIPRPDRDKTHLASPPPASDAIHAPASA